MGMSMGISGVLALVNMLGGLIFGYNTGVIAGALGRISLTGGKHWILSNSMEGVVTASILVGALFGSMIGGPIADRFGRKVGIIILALIELVFAPALAASPSVIILVLARGCLGVGVGMAGIICPMYVSENAPPERRGALGVLFQLAITIGICFAYVSNMVFEGVRHDWRIMFALGAIPALILLLVAFVIPESFVWLAKRTGSGEHSALLTNNPAITTSKRQPGAGSSRGFARRLTFGERMSLFMASKALRVGIVLAIAQQLTGINAIMFYAPIIFKDAGVKDSNLPTIGLGIWNVLATVIALPLVDRLGRRPLLILGTLVMSIACIALGITYKFIHGVATGYVAIALLLVFVLAFELGDGPLFWMVAHELFTPEIKTVGASTLNAAQWIFNIILCFFFPIARNSWGQSYVFYVFGVIGALCTTAMVLFLPETRPKAPTTHI